MSDLLNKLNDMGNKPNSVEGAGKKASEPQRPAANSATTSEFDRGDDIIAKAGGKTSDGTPTTVKTSSAESGKSPTSASSTEEPTGSQANPTDWTVDSAVKEVKKLREENKSYRIKYQEQLEKLKAEADLAVKAKEEEMNSFIEAKKELDRLKADQEDKKRDLSEKLAHREAKVAEYQTLLDASKKQFETERRQLNEKLAHYEADRQAEAQVYEARLNEELASIPEKFREHASLLVKGAGDKRDALIALSEAKLKGMFEDRTVIVNHSVPGAHDGARANKERLDEADRSRRERMSSSQKIGESLKAIKQGTPNTAFRTK